MGYVIFRGYSTDTSATISSSICSGKLTGVVVSKMPSHKKASMRLTEYYVKGRDGALHVNEGFANFSLTVQVVLLDKAATTRQVVNSWADGTGKLITSDDLTKAYKATVEQEVVWSRVPGNTGFYDTATITFNCQPFMVEAVDSVTTLTASGTLTNLGTDESFPTIVVNGSGDVSFNIAGQTVTINDMTANVPVTLDCENGYVYAASGSFTMVGDFPTIPVGTSSVTLGEGITSLVITPHWRWV